MNTLKKNQSVIVKDPNINDLWNHSFSGTIIKVNKDSILVEDQDGDFFEVSKDQLEVEN